MTKITKATVKSFVRKNAGNLYVNQKSCFSGMTDGIERCDKGFLPASPAHNSAPEHDLGMEGVWMVGESRDYFTSFENEDFKGFECYNCCGKFIIAVKKTA